MNIEFLYFEDCPNAGPAWNLLQEVLNAHGIEEPPQRIHVETVEQAHRHRFLGSPTIRIDGRDVAEEDTDYGLKCRVYTVNGHLQPLPPRQWIEQAVFKSKIAS